MAGVAISFAAGIVAAEYLAPVLCVLLSAIVFAAAFLVPRRESRTILLILACTFALGAARHAAGLSVPIDDVSRMARPVTAIEGTVASDPEAVSDHVRLVMRVRRARNTRGWQPAGGRIMVNLYCDGPTLQYGDLARMTASVYTPQEPTNPNQFSWKNYLSRQGIYACASVRRPEQVTRMRGNSANPLVSASLSAKHWLTRAIQRNCPGHVAPVIIGMVLGTYSYLPREQLRNFSRTGTLHLLAASGYNCFLVVFLFGPILRLAQVLPRYRNPLIIALLVFYLLMVGAKPSLVRATVMASLLLLAAVLHRAHNVKNLFYVAAFVLLMIAPSDLFDVGFQLSFLGVWALIEISPVIEAILSKTGWTPEDQRRPRKLAHRAVRKIGGALTGAAVGTAACSIVTAPVVAYHFNYVSLVSLPANVTMALGVPVVFAGGLGAALLSFVPVIGQVCGWVGSVTTTAMLATVNSLGSVPYSAISIASPGVLAITGYYITLYAALAYVRTKVPHN